MKKKLLLLLTLCFISGRAMADLSVFPQAVDFPEDSRKRSQTIHILNQSKTRQTYRVSMVEYTQDEDGQYHKADSVENSAQKYLIYSPKQFTLEPGKLQAIRVARKGLGNAKDGEYVSHLMVKEVEMPHMKKAEKAKEVKDNEENTEGEEKKTQLSISINTLFGVTVPVTIYKGKDLHQSTKILSHKYQDDSLNLVLQRQGNISSRLKFKVFDAEGKRIGKAGPVRIYTPNGKRNLSIALEKGKKPVKIEMDDALTNQKIMEKAL